MAMTKEEILMNRVSDFVNDLSYQAESNAESRHSGSLFVDDIFGPDKRMERTNKFHPKSRMTLRKALPKPNKSCAAEMPSSTSQVSDSFGIKSTVEVSISVKSLEGSVCSSMASPVHCVFQDLRSDSEIPISTNVLNGIAQLDSGCSQEGEDMVCHLKPLDGDAQAASNSGIMDDNQPNNIPLSESTESLGPDNPTHGGFESVEGLTQGFSSLIDTCSSEFNANIGLCSTLDVVIPVQPSHLVPNSFQSCSFTQISEEKTALYNDEDLTGSLFDNYPICETASLLSSTIIEGNNGGKTNEEPLAGSESSDLSTSAEMVNAIVQQTPATVQEKIVSNSSSCSGGIQSVCTSNPDSAGSQQMVISSVVTDSPLVSNAYDENVEASLLSESLVNLQACSDKLEAVSIAGVSSMDCIDDLLCQHVPSDVKRIGKFRPKPAVRLKDAKKTKSVSFITPNPGESAATVDCQTKSNPAETAPSFIEIMGEDNMEDGLISLPICKKDNHVNFGCSLTEAVIDISNLDSTEPVFNSDQHVSKFAEEITFNAKKSDNASICPAVDIKSGYGRLDSPPRNNELLDAHCLGFTYGDLANSLTMQGYCSLPSNASEEGACLASTCDLGVLSLDDNANFCMTEGERGVDNVVETIHEGTCTANATQSDETRRFPWNLRRRNKSRTNMGNSIFSEDEIAANTSISESDEENGVDVDNDEDMAKKKKGKYSASLSAPLQGKMGLPRIAKLLTKLTLWLRVLQRRGSRMVFDAEGQKVVDKALLEIPDDELDRSQIAIRDLIRLAEFKERTCDSFANVNNVNDEDFNEDKEDSNSDGANEGIKLQASKLNYHSDMKRPKQIRWSKMDTELFYQNYPSPPLSCPSRDNEEQRLE
ncbi:hypothetical protein HPP92_008918 [Vanilla planifolia]|uniref:Uncharacterized protein n=1 Tax=Vanilla planifolia TaxID=51239 RepID=A0A835V2D4_VANPL|nr:hypothetical protein HPP92_008918 [Vanilla planifolia]